MALAGTRGIANAAVAEAASATAIKPALINRFIGILLHRASRHLAQVPKPSFCSKAFLATPILQNVADLREVIGIAVFSRFDCRRGNFF
jgi:hypothetical protein